MSESTALRSPTNRTATSQPFGSRAPRTADWQERRLRLAENRTASREAAGARSRIDSSGAAGTWLARKSELLSRVRTVWTARPAEQGRSIDALSSCRGVGDGVDHRTHGDRLPPRTRTRTGSRRRPRGDTPICRASGTRPPAPPSSGRPTPATASSSARRRRPSASGAVSRRSMRRRGRAAPATTAHSGATARATRSPARR